MTFRIAAATLLLSITSVLPVAAQSPTARCKGDNGGLTLAPGFCATVFADNLGHVRHLVAAPDGTLYANTWVGGYFSRSASPPDGIIIALKDTKASGSADVVQRFGPKPGQGEGGTGIALYKDGLFVEEKGTIQRYTLKPGSIVPGDAPVTVLSGMALDGDHPMHPFIIGPKGDLFVDFASATNSCQPINRVPFIKGHDPCTEKEVRGGIWRYDANKTGQVASAKERYASGNRNGEGFAFDAAGRLFVTQHGRDQLYQNWPTLYSAEQSADLPAEELMELVEGADYGWPYCYYDQNQKKLVLAPEYGGDGGKAVGRCGQYKAPVAGFPGHWAPNDLAIYLGTKFPEAYRGGAFIAFEGSWNRAPMPQGGYNVVFQPLKDGKASGPYVVFADGFAGPRREPGRAEHRPTGLAVAPDGALFVSDEIKGRIWRITYEGDGSDQLAAARPAGGSASNAPLVQPPEGNNPTAGLPTPPGATAADVTRGARVFASQGCAGCHGSDGKGTNVGPPFKAGKFEWSDGSLAGLSSTIEKGVAKPKHYTGVMPPMGGGTPLSKTDLSAVTAYVWALSHAPGQ